MSYFRDRYQGIGAIAAAAPAPRSAPAPTVRTGVYSAPQTSCRLSSDTVRRPDGTIEKVNYREAMLYPMCSGATSQPPPPQPTSSTSKLAMINQATMATGVSTSMTTVKPSGGIVSGTFQPVTQPVTDSSGSSIGPYKPPVEPTPTPTPSPTPVTTVTTISGGGSRGGIMTAPPPPSKPTFQPLPPLPVLDEPATPSATGKKVPWVAIGLGAGVIAALVLLSKKKRK